MIDYREIFIEKENHAVATIGLKKKIGKEIRIQVQSKEDSEYVKVLMYLIDFILDNKPQISDNQTIAYHSWILRFSSTTTPKYFDLYESGADGEGYVSGCDYSIHVVHAQERMCKELSVSPVFPLFSQNVVISKGVYEGHDVEAVRYPSPAHMTGWWITTDLYDGHTDSLMVVHYYHIAFKRPDLLPYIALPHGYRFFKSDQNHDIWFDENIK